MAKEKIKNIGAMKEKRPPTKQEISDVSRHMRAHYRMLDMIYKGSTIFMLLMGAVIFTGGVIEKKHAMWITGLILLAVSILITRMIPKSRKECAVFENGRFYVIDGTITSRRVSDMPGSSDVEFTSRDGQTFDGRFEVRKEGLYIGCPAILVYVPKQELCGISDFTWVFTPFMLTEEGAKKHK